MKKILFALLFAVSLAGAQTIVTENFTTDPLLNGWQVFGDTNLFQWDSTSHNLAVTWDSSQVNSYFSHPLGVTLTTNDGFTLEFDLQLTNADAVGSFELAVGLFNYSEATNADFARPLANTPNLFEFDYFPDGGYGPSIDATLADMTNSDTNQNNFYFAYDTVPLNLGATYHIILTHIAGTTNLSGAVLTGGQIYTSLPNPYPGPITDFRLDTVSISSYSAAEDTYGDSLLAGGTIGNLKVAIQPIGNLAGAFSNAVWQVQFNSRTNWSYALDRTTNFQSWTAVSATNTGNGSILQLQDSAPPANNAFYRVRALQP